MKTYDEYAENIRKKVEQTKLRRRRTVLSVAAMVMVVAMGLTCIYPVVMGDGGGQTNVENTQQPSGNGSVNLEDYADSPYYALICQLNTAMDMEDDNVYDFTGAAGPADDGAPEASSGSVEEDGIGGIDDGQTYEEVTDNQVSGVVEGDLFKRSDRYLYYIKDDTLLVYSIQGEDSALVGSYIMDSTAWSTFYNKEMYLSQDCKTVTVISFGFLSKEFRTYTVLTQLDVSDPGNITLKRQIVVNSYFQSSRMVDGTLLLETTYTVKKSTVDYALPETFVPCYGTVGNLTPLTEDRIVWQEDCYDTVYTVLTKLDADTLEVADSVALLGYSTTMYVSQSTAYFSCAVSRYTPLEDDSYSTRSTWTTVTGINYLGQGLEILGSVELEGTVDDQYSMDEYEGILRVATTTARRKFRMLDGGAVQTAGNTIRNGSLYCVDLDSWEIAASVEDFAPEGEQVCSARFDGAYAYICTAEVVILSDPVYFFDLSDLENITCKYTPVIGGYSTSLIQYEDFLLGVGYGDDWMLKIEVYQETQDAVEAIYAYTAYAVSSGEYKSYFIDRENGLFGLGIEQCDDEGWTCHYLLLKWNGSELVTLVDIPMDSTYISYYRAALIDGYLYVLNWNGLSVTAVSW